MIIFYEKISALYHKILLQHAACDVIGRKHMEDLEVDVKVIFKWFLHKHGLIHQAKDKAQWL